MKTFKDIVKNDVEATFFNDSEFSENHNLNGTDILIQVDNDLLKERQSKFAEGTYLGDVLFFAKKTEVDSIFGDKPAREQLVRFDNEPMRIVDCEEDAGIYYITLQEGLS